MEGIQLPGIPSQQSSGSVGGCYGGVPDFVGDSEDSGALVRSWKSKIEGVIRHVCPKRGSWNSGKA
jgi:hypothetical protein